METNKQILDKILTEIISNDSVVSDKVKELATLALNDEEYIVAFVMLRTYIVICFPKFKEAEDFMENSLIKDIFNNFLQLLQQKN